MKINKWANSLLIDHNYWIRFVTKDSLSKIRVDRSRMFGDEDITQTYILNGYAIFIGDKNSTKYIDYMEDQNTARNNKKGIWSLEPSVLSELSNRGILPKKLRTTIELKSKSDQNVLSYESHIKSEKPYLPLLALSAVSLFLAWDNFATASDYQNTIDRTNDQITGLKNTLNHTDPYYNATTWTAINQSIKDAQDIVNDAQKTKNRKTIVGVACIATALVTTIFAFKEVQVKTDLQSLTLSYRF